MADSTSFDVKVQNFISEWQDGTASVTVQSSGSTGTPKIFEIEKEKMRHSAEMTCDFLNLKPSDTALLCLPVEYISGKMMVVRSIVRHMRLLVAEPALTPLKNLDTSVDFCAMTPLQVEHSLDQLHLIKTLIIGGAAVAEQLKTKIFAAFSGTQSDIRIFETYGMTETLSHIALKQIYPTTEAYFTVLKDVEISVDERGCLKIFAPKLNPEVLQTNDLVETVHEKQFRFLGRIDNVINSGGAKIFPEELEALARKEIPNEIVFLGLEDAVLGQRLVAVIEGESHEDLKQKISGIAYAKSFHRPKEIIFISQIPRTPNGKVSRAALKALIEA